MSKFIEGMIECPFYLKEGDKYIVCEGIADGAKCVHRFKDNVQKSLYEVDFCSSRNGKKCQYYRTLSMLYERGLKT